ncbi:MAG: GAF domain-containing protein [Verrucomicrobia bacterium]|nr:GAF domain-containing protein [Verrucomicrobiota bacterium]
MRFTLLPDPRFRKHFSALADRLDKAAQLVTRETFSDFVDDLMTTVLKDGFAAAGADEGTLWLVNARKRKLDAVFNDGPRAKKMRELSQTLDRGLISMVFSTGQPFCENNIEQNPDHDKAVDRQMGSPTTAMIAVPFYFAQECRGIVSCVHLAKKPGSAPAQKDFDMESMREVTRAASLLTRLFDLKLISRIIGYGHD